MQSFFSPCKKKNRQTLSIVLVDAPFCPGYCLYLFYQALESFRLNFYFMLFLSNCYLCLFIVSWKCHIVLYFCFYVILFNVVFYYYYLSLSFLVIVLLFLFALLFYFYSIFVVSIGLWPKPNIGPILTHFAGLFSKHQIKPIPAFLKKQRQAKSGLEATSSKLSHEALQHVKSGMFPNLSEHTLAGLIGPPNSRPSINDFFTQSHVPACCCSFHATAHLD